MAGTQYPKPIRLWGVRIAWTNFIDRCLKGIFFVTEVATRPSNVVWHAFNPEVFYPAQVRPKRLLTIGYVGRLERQKGIEQVLGLMTELQGQPVRCIIAGSGVLRTLVEQAVTQGQVEYRGTLKGSALAETYREMDFLLLPSLRTAGWEEAFGMVVIEAMACGVIPLVTNHSGPVAILKDHLSELFFQNLNSGLQ
jgi:glycosyltransferase involved in cell wall biosynthesis